MEKRFGECHNNCLVLPHHGRSHRLLPDVEVTSAQPHSMAPHTQLGNQPIAATVEYGRDVSDSFSLPGPRLSCDNYNPGNEIDQSDEAAANSKSPVRREPERTSIEVEQLQPAMPTGGRPLTMEQLLAQMHKQMKTELRQHQEQIDNLQSQIITMRNDNFHLQKRCKFLGKKCDKYEQRQMRMEATLIKKRELILGEQSSGSRLNDARRDKDDYGDSKTDDDDDHAVDEAAEAFFAEDNDDDDDNEVIEASDDNLKSKIVPNHVVFAPQEHDFEEMFEKLRNHLQQNGSFGFTDQHDQQLRKWVTYWKTRKRKFDKMVVEDGGPTVVFPGLRDVDHKIDTNEIPAYDYKLENQQVRHIPTARAQTRRRYLLRLRHRIICFNSIGFVWTVCSQPRFEDRLEQLQSFIKVHGHYNVPREFGPLGEWFHMMKTNFVLGKKHFMAKQNLKLLEIGVDMNIAVQGRRKRRRKVTRKRDMSEVAKCGIIT